MPRYKLIIEYDGAPFVGWQRQENGPSVQETLGKAASKLSGGENILPHSAGRTDAGVHALAMSVHLDFEKEFSTDVVRDGLNQHLKPAAIAVLSAENVSDEFHARFSCVGRVYEYRIINRRPSLTLEKGRAWRIPAPLDTDLMHEAAQILLGKHDFTTFRAAACQAASPVKSLSEISVSRAGVDVFVRCSAKSFLHNQVRSFVGSLVEVGKGKWSTRDLQTALRAKDRARCGPVAPAEGLYFLRADYESH